MPSYTYSCEMHGEIELNHSIHDDSEKLCEECKKQGKESVMKRLISSTGFILQGGGWFKEGYSK